jgi:3-methyladenine DNA glycosylase AlkD
MHSFRIFAEVQDNYFPSMSNAAHKEILALIQKNSGKGTKHTFLDSYLGTTHSRYAINAPVLRKIAGDWMKAHRDLHARDFEKLLTSLIEAPSSTEKVMAGILMDCATTEQRKINPKIFDHWLDRLEGWAEVDALCTGKFMVHYLPAEWEKWKLLLKKFSASKNIQKRRASLVSLCSPIRYCEESEMADVALANIDKLKSEKAILITKAISWLLRSMIKLHRQSVIDYLRQNRSSLPAIAVRETEKVLRTGKKTA